jgi:hypothetical protein
MTKSLRSVQSVFAYLPDTLRDELLEEFDSIVSNYYQEKWTTAELSGGKFCEIVYSIIEGLGTNKFPAHAAKPPSMETSCRLLAEYNNLSDSLRLSIPRALIFLYDVRNRRGVGHVSGGKIDPNHMDALVVVSTARWIMAELVRETHEVDIGLAQSIVDNLTDRIIPIVWTNNGVKRVLRPSLSAKEQMLVLVYAESGKMKASDIVKSIEYKNSTQFKKNILAKLHQSRVIEYDSKKELVVLTPIGNEQAERIIRKSIESEETK